MIDRTLGHYRILEKLGEGGMGVVYLAEDTRLQRRVALKLLAPAMAREPERLRRFEREAKTVASLNHPNIVTLYSVEEADGERFLTMEYVDGMTLDELVPRQGLDTADVLRLGRQLADAVATAHQRGITHRDLKPGNVMVTLDNRVKVLDFGLAKLFDDDSTQLHGLAPDNLTREGSIVGTLAYMSPERLQGRAADPRADVFALGVLLYEMSTGARPFSGGNSAELISAVLRDQPPPLRRLKPDLPGGLGDVIMKCLDKNPETRLQNGAAVREALERVEQNLTSSRILRSGAIVVAKAGGAARLLAICAVAAAVALAGFWLAWPRAKAGGATGAAASPARAATAPAIPAEMPSIAVLPLRNYTSEQEYFVDGMTDGVINALARMGGVRVISRQSAMHYKGSTRLLPDIARELGVGYILEGSVERSSGTVRLAVNLLRGDPETQVWSGNLERPAREVLALQSELARQVAMVARFPLSGRDSQRLAAARAVAPEVYELYLQGDFLADQMSEESLRRAQESFEQAIRMDPTFAPAYASLADSYAIQGYLFADPSAALAKAEAAASKALELDPESAEGHASLAYVHHFFRYDWNGAEAEYKRALEINPNYAPARRRYWALLEVLGRHEAAGEEIRRALEIDPLSPNTHANFALHLLAGGATAEALERLDHGLELWRHDGALRLYRWQAVEALGRPAQERRAALLDALQDLGYPDAAAACQSAPAATPLPRLFGAVADALSRESASRRVLPTFVAEVYLAAGAKPAALDWLQRGLAAHSPDMADFLVYPRWREMARDPRFQRILDQLGLPAEKPAGS
jgi:serine/threonine-protein kinase